MAEREQVGALFSLHGGFVQRALRRMGVSEADVPDLTQDVFLVVHRRLSGFEGRSTMQTWLYGICLRVAADHRKRTRRRWAVFSSARGEASVAPRQHERLLLHEARLTLERALLDMSDGQRRAFVAFEIEERPMAEVARELGCPIKTAFSRLHTARKRINRSLARQHGLGVAFIVPMLSPRVAAASAWVGGAAGAAACAACLLVSPASTSMTLAHTNGRLAIGPRVAVLVMPRAIPAKDRAPRASRIVRPTSAAAQEPQMAQLEQAEQVELEVQHRDLPGAELTLRRIALSEVVPVYRLRN